MPVDGLPLLRPLWLLALPAAALLVWWLARRHPRAGGWAALIDPHLRPALLGPARPLDRLGPALLVGLGLALLVLALAGPAWRLVERPLFRLEQARVLVLDLSPSMDRADLPPSRLGRARFELLDLLAAGDEGHTALIVFGAEPFLIAPLTTDTGTIAAQVPALTTDVLPLRGAPRPELALDLARALLTGAGAGAGRVILLTDGATDPSAAVPLARRLAATGHRLDVLALAADSGAPTLAPWRALARAGGGVLVLARPNDADLTALLPATADPGRLRPTTDEPARPQRLADDGPWLLLALLPLAALAGRRGWLGGRVGAWGGLAAALLLAATLPGIPVASAGAGAPGAQPAPGTWWRNLWQRPDQQAVAALTAGDTTAASGRPADPRLTDPLWQAAARYQAGDYQQALDLLRGQTGPAAHYNRGNALARLGRWREAVAEYEATLTLAPTHRDARHNRDLLLGLLAPAAAETGPAVTDSGAGDQSGEGEAAGEPGAEPTPGNGAAADRQPAIGVGMADPGGPAGTPGQPGERTASGIQGADPSRAEGAPAPHTHAAVAEPPAADAATEDGEEPVEPADAGAARLLRQIEDDPGSLLRERLRLQYLRRHGQLY